MKDIGPLNWPVIVGSTDSAGSKGVTKLDNPEELEKAIEYALSFSRLDEFIIEDFFTQKCFSSDTDSFSVDGQLKFASFDCQCFDKKAVNPYTSFVYSWPSSRNDKKQEELKNDPQKLIRLLGMKTAVYNSEAKERLDDKAYIMKMSARR